MDLTERRNELIEKHGNLPENSQGFYSKVLTNVADKPLYHIGQTVFIASSDIDGYKHNDNKGFYYPCLWQAVITGVRICQYEDYHLGDNDVLNDDVLRKNAYYRYFVNTLRREYTDDSVCVNEYLIYTDIEEFYKEVIERIKEDRAFNRKNPIK